MNEEHSCLKIGLDYHGVINTDIAYFKQFCMEAIERGHEIHILSGGPEQEIIHHLQETGIRYTRVFTIFDFYNEKGLACRLPNGDFYVDENLWNETKAEYCRQNKINVQIDDSPIYGKYFTTPYCLYNHQEKKCVLLSQNESIDLTRDAHAAVCRLEQIL